MLTAFVRDQLFTIAWFGLMTFVWFGWAQEAPAPTMRWKLGVGSVLGLSLAVGFGIGTFNRRAEASALTGNYHWFGVLVAAEVVLAGLGAWWLIRRNESRWIAWWVAVVVALHFIPLAMLLRDWSVAALGVVQGALLVALLPRLREQSVTTSRVVGPVMGASLLAFAVASAVVLVRHGA